MKTTVRAALLCSAFLMNVPLFAQVQTKIVAICTDHHMGLNVGVDHDGMMLNLTGAAWDNVSNKSQAVTDSSPSAIEVVYSNESVSITINTKTNIGTLSFYGGEPESLGYCHID